MGSAPFTCQRDGDVFVVGGSIDERAQLVPLLKWARQGVLILDLGAVTFVNSLGVREWVRLQTTARDSGVKLELRRVAEVLIHQINVVPAARAASNVKSFFATYFCESCGEEQPELLEVAGLEKHAAPAMKCRACKQPAVLSEAPELYFSFLAGTSPLR
jgi:anti-anti-sigma regulatory factor